MINVLEKIEHKVIDLIDVHQDILLIVKNLREENRDLKEKMQILQNEKDLMDQRLEKILTTMQEVGEYVNGQNESSANTSPERQYS